MPDSPYSIDVTNEQFETLGLQASAHTPVLVDFWAAWCAPCRSLKPLLEKLAADYNGGFLLAKVDTEQQQDLASRYGIRSLPTVKLFKDGVEVDQFMGALAEEAVRELLDRHLQVVPKASDELRARAQAALGADDTDTALALLRQAAADDPDNWLVQADLAGLLLELGDSGGAQGHLQAIPDKHHEQPEYKALAARLSFAGSGSAAPEELRQALASPPDDPDTRRHLIDALVDALVQNGDYRGAMDLLLTQVGRGDVAARERMLTLFDLVDDAALIAHYRRQLFNALH
jgi:putative thioredoxin